MEDSLSFQIMESFGMLWRSMSMQSRKRRTSVFNFRRRIDIPQETELCLPGHFGPSSSCEDVFVSSVFLWIMITVLISQLHEFKWITL